MKVPQRVWEETRFLWDPMMIQGEFGEFIGIGGTLTTLAAIDLGLENYDGTKVQGHKLSRETVEGIILNLRYMSRDERLQGKRFTCRTCRYHRSWCRNFNVLYGCLMRFLMYL